MTATDAAAVKRKGRSIHDRITEMTGGAAFYPLAILFGLNILDELDRNAFNVLLPEIRDYFGLDNTGILSVVALAGAAALLLTVPVVDAGRPATAA